MEKNKYKGFSHLKMYSIYSKPEKSLSEESWCCTKHGVPKLYGCCFCSGRLVSNTSHLMSINSRVNFHKGKGSFRFKRLLEFFVDSCLHLSSIDEVVSCCCKLHVNS